MDLRHFARLRKGLAGAALMGATALTLLIGASSSERMVQAGFEVALSQRDEGSAALPAASGAVPMAQSEDFWLRHGGEASAIKPVSWQGAITRGDKLTISTSGAQARTFEVLEATSMPGSTRLDTATTAAEHLVAVLCRDIDRPDAAPVRFVISEGGALPTPAAKAL
jgi:hypothetical protein